MIWRNCEKRSLGILILNDTSIWIECFRDESSLIAQFVVDKIKEDEITYNGIILGELLQGAKTKREYAQMKTALEVLPYLEFDYATWSKGSEIAFILRNKGITLPLADCLIAAQCLQVDCKLFTSDKHFEMIVEEFPLKLIEIQN